MSTTETPTKDNRKNSELIAEWQRTIWVKPDDSFIIGRTSQGSVLGPASASDLTVGLTYRFYGHHEDSEQYGAQFKFRDFVKVIPHSATGVVEYITRTCKGTGLGSMSARRIVDAYGADKAVPMLRSSPEKVAEEIPRLTPESARQASVLLMEDAHHAEGKIEIVGLLANRGFPQILPNEIIKQYGASAAEKIKQNPFCLMLDGFNGCGFQRVDRLYCDLGLPQDAIERIMFCCWYVIGQSSGSVWVPYTQVKRESGELATIPTDVDKAIEHGITHEWLAMRDIQGEKFLSRFKDDQIESELSGTIIEMVSNHAPF